MRRYDLDSLSDNDIDRNIKRIVQEYGGLPKDEDYYNEDTDSERAARIQRTAENAQNRSNFTRGLVRGVDSLQGMGYGLLGLAGNAIGADKVEDWGYKNMLRNEREAGENTPDVKNFWSGDENDGAFGSFGNMAKWSAGAMGEALPSLAEGLLSGLAGSLAASQIVPGAGPDDLVAAPAGGLVGFFAKNAVKKHIKKLAIEKGISITAAKKLVSPQLQKQIYRNAIQRFGANAGVTLGMGGIEAGSNWGELKKEGIEAPVSSLLMGLVSGASETMLGNVPLAMRSFVTSPAKNEARKHGVKAATGWLWDAMKNGGEEFGQEAFQEFLSSLNQEINDPNFKITSKETFMQWMEAGAAGGIAGLGFKAALGPKDLYDHLKQPAPGINNDTPTPEVNLLPATEDIPANDSIAPEDIQPEAFQEPNQEVANLNQRFGVPGTDEAIDVESVPLIEDVPVPGPANISVPTLNIEEFMRRKMKAAEVSHKVPKLPAASETALEPDPEIVQDTPVVEENKYLTMPIDVVQRHAELGVLDAKEALATRENEVGYSDSQMPQVDQNETISAQNEVEQFKPETAQVVHNEAVPASKQIETAKPKVKSSSPIARALTESIAESGDTSKSAFKAEKGKKYPNSVLFDVRDYDSRSIGVFGVNYDGTMEDAAKANELGRASLEHVLGGSWSNMETRTGATDKNGKGKWSISPNSKVIKDVRKSAPKKTKTNPDDKKSWYINADDRPVYTTRKEATRNSMRGPYTKGDVAWLTGTDYSYMKTDGKPVYTPDYPASDSLVNTKTDQKIDAVIYDKIRHLSPEEMQGAWTTTLKPKDTFTFNGQNFRVVFNTEKQLRISNEKELYTFKKLPSGDFMTEGKAANFLRDVDGQITADLLNENNKFYEPSDVFKLTVKAIEQLSSQDTEKLNNNSLQKNKGTFDFNKTADVLFNEEHTAKELENKIENFFSSLPSSEYKNSENEIITAQKIKGIHSLVKKAFAKYHGINDYYQDEKMLLLHNIKKTINLLWPKKANNKTKSLKLAKSSDPIDNKKSPRYTNDISPKEQHEDSTQNTGSTRQTDKPGRKGLSNSGTAQGRSRKNSGDGTVSPRRSNAVESNSSADADSHGHERAVGSDLQNDGLLPEPDAMGQQQASGNAGADLQQQGTGTLSGRNEVVPGASGSNNGNGTGTNTGRPNFDLRVSPEIQLTKGERKRINKSVKEILKKDSFTDSDLETLRQYTGEGGLSSGTKEALTQHFTGYDTIRAMFRAITASGFSYKNALEPAVGSGSFVGNMPELRWTTIDIDPTNHKVSSALYPEATHYLTSFDNYKEAEHDLIISNVPFLEKRSMASKRRDIKALHDFYFIHALDLVKENGIVAFITSSGTMDKKNSKIREEIVSKADIIGAYRLPGGHFEKGAHTSVITDIIFMQKRPEGVKPKFMQRLKNQRFTESTETKDGIFLSRYYQVHKDNILGELVAGVNKLYGGRPAYEVKGEADLSKISISYNEYAYEPDLDSIMDKSIKDEIPTNSKEFKKWADENGIYVQRDMMIPTDTGHYQQCDPHFSAGIIIEHDGKAYEAFQEVQFSDIEGTGKVYREIVRHKGKLLMLDKINKLAMEFQQDGNQDTADQALDLIDQYRTEFKKAPHKDMTFRSMFNRTNEHSYYAELTALFDENFEPADIFKVQTRHINSGVAQVDSDSPVIDRAFASEDNRGQIDIDKSALLSRADISKLITSGYSIVEYNKKSAVLQNDVLYYSGNIYKKIEQAKLITDSRIEIKSKIENQIERLKTIMPEAKSLDEIHLKGNEGWLLSILKDHGIETITSHIDKNGMRTYKTRNSDKIFENHLNNQALITRKNNDGWVEPINKYMARLREAEEHVTEVLYHLKKGLRERGLHEEIEYSYNSHYRNYVKPDYAKAQYLIQDVLDEIKDSGITLRKNQVEWIIQATYEGIGINGHDVGGGKTFAAITLARVLKKKGIAQKPLFVVPAKTIKNWEKEIKILFPLAKIFNLGNLNAKQRTDKLFKLANTNADYVLISHEGFKQIKLPLGRELEYVDDLLREHIDDPEASNREKGLLEEKIDGYKKILTNDKRNSRLTFDKLGVDAIIADEAHNFKNIGIRNKLNKFGLGTAFGVNSGKDGALSLKSARSYDFRFKANYITENNNDKNVFLLSATPTPNKPMEAYTMLRHLGRNIFAEYGIYSDLDFSNTFLSLGTVKSGEKQKSILKAIVNAIDFRGILNRFVDKLSMEQMPWIKVPEANYIDHHFEQSTEMELINADMRERDEKRPKGQDVQAGDDTLIAIYSGGRNASVDPRLYGGEHAGVSIEQRSFDPQNDKVQFTIEEVSKVAKKNKQAGQLVFLDASGNTQMKKGKLKESIHAEIKRELVERGMDPTEVAIINGSVITNAATGKEVSSGNKEERKQAIVEAYNAGAIRVVIGTTTSMGEGMNLQVPTTDIWHMDIPYTPGAIRQRNGRGVRYKNRNDKVNIHMMFMQGSFDSASFELVSTKKGWNEAIWDKEVADVISTEEDFGEGAMPPAKKMRIEMEPDPVKKKILQLEFEYETLYEDRGANTSFLWSLRSRIQKTEAQIADNEQNLRSRQRKLQAAKPNTKIKNLKKRAEAFEGSKKNMAHLVKVSERYIAEGNEKLAKLNKQLEEAEAEGKRLADRIEEFNQNHVNEDGEIVIEKNQLVDSESESLSDLTDKRKSRSSSTGSDNSIHKQQSKKNIDKDANNVKYRNIEFEYRDINLGDKVKARRFVNKMTGRNDQVNFVRKLFSSTGREILGRYHNAYIDIAENKGNVENTARHEALHYAYDLLLTEREAEMFDNAAKHQNLTHEEAIEGVNQFARHGEGMFGTLRLIGLRLLRRIRQLFGQERAIDWIHEVYDKTLSGIYAKRGLTGYSNYGDKVKYMSVDQRTHLAKLIEKFKNELSDVKLNKEQQGVYDVVTGDKHTTQIRKSDLDHLGSSTVCAVNKQRMIFISDTFLQTGCFLHAEP